LDFGGLRFSADLIVLQGRDPLGTPFILLLLHTAAPRTYYTLELLFTVENEVEEPPVAIITLADFSDSPGPIITRPSEQGFGWTEMLVKVALFGESRWIGLAVSPSNG
jgi:hypothetical protein